MPLRPPIHRNPHTVAPKRPRPSSAQRGYTHAWKVAREKFLRDNALCVHCLREGREVLATCIDHSNGHAPGRENFWDVSAWVASCKSCNSRWAAKCEGGFGNPRRQRPELHHLPPQKFRETFFL